MWNWLKSNAAPTITILGVLIYVMFLIPETLFYDNLRTTPSEVGLTYFSALTRAVPGLVVALVLLVVYLFLAIGIAYFLAFALYLFLLGPSVVLPSLSTMDGQVDQAKFERNLRIMRFLYREPEPAWPEVEYELRRRRELQGVAEPWTVAQQRKIQDVTKKYSYGKIVGSIYPALGRWLCRYRSLFYGLVFVGFCFLIVRATIWAGGVAVKQADEVRSGGLPAGIQLGFLGYQVETVYVRSASTDSSITVRALAGEPVFMLGQNSENVVIYVPKCDATVRIPVAIVTISSAPTEGTGGRQKGDNCSDLQ